MDFTFTKTYEMRGKMSSAKIILMLSAIATGTALGINRGNRLTGQYQELLYLKKMVLLIQGEIRYNCGTIGEVFLNISKRLKEPYKSSFVELSKQLEKCRGEAFSDMWNTCIIEPAMQSGLSGQDMESFRELGENLGYLDIQMQLNYLDFYIEKLNARIAEVKAGLDGNVKLCRTLGIMGGLLAAVFIM